MSALILCTCHNVILMGRTASWDIYCHAFMLGAVYHLAVAIKGMGGKWRHCIVAGVLAGLSIMSKGPVSVYALLLPFVIAFAFVMRPCIKGCRGCDWRNVCDCIGGGRMMVCIYSFILSE